MGSDAGGIQNNLSCRLTNPNRHRIMRNEHKNKHAAKLGRLGGLASAKVRTKAKANASRANGKKGGRPKKAAAAPDKAKLKAIAASVRKLEVPTVTTPEGEAVLAEIKAKIEGFAKWIEAQTEKL